LALTAAGREYPSGFARHVGTMRTAHPEGNRTKPMTHTQCGPETDRARRFEELTLPHLRSLYWLALRLAGNAAAAEDLVQETYLKALQAFETLRDPSRAKPWLFQILSRLAIDRHRVYSREVPIEDAEDLDRFSLYDRIAEEDPFPYSDHLHDDFLA